MNTRAETLFGRSAAPSVRATEAAEDKALCFHCGLDVPDNTDFTLEIDQRMRRMCCVGCLNVAQTIIHAGLVDFYRHRVGFSDQFDPSNLPAPDALQASSSDNPAAISERKTPSPAQLTLYLHGLRCAACVWLAEHVLNSVPGVDRISVNLTTQVARVRVDQNRSSETTIVAALARVGLRAEPAEHEARMQARKLQRRTQLLELGVAALCMMQVMMLVVPIYLADPSDISNDGKQLMSWAAWLLTLPVLLFSARPIFLNAFRTVSHTLKDGYVGMDVPVAIALLLTFVSSTVALITQSGQHYFDAITMFVFLLLGARWIESSLRLRTTESIDRLTNATPLRCLKLVDYPASESTLNISAAKLSVGDLVSIRPGESVPADAIVVRGQSELNEALMTGESRPVPRREGDALIGGTINMHSPLVARITAVGDKTLLSRLGQMVEAGLLYRPQFQGVAERAARWLAPGTLITAALAAVLWSQIDPTRAAEIAIAVLAVTCPCAFAIAAPVALASALSRMTHDGLLVARGHLVETLARATDVVFDKTGTLTTGRMAVSTFECDPKKRMEALQVAASLEQGAIHPAAAAIIGYAHQSGVGDVPVATSLVSVPGEGIEGTVAGRRYRLGKRSFVTSQPIDPAPSPAPSTSLVETEIVLASMDKDCALVATFRLADPIRADADRCIDQLTRSGIRVHLLSGDGEAVVNAVATRLGIAAERTLASQLPQHKQAYVAALRQRGATVVAVGDGVNDAPMLASANGSIGLAEGATLTRVSADAVLAANRGDLLAALANAFVVARDARNIIKQNLGWALAYNLVAVPLAVAGYVTPLVAALGMALSSLIVVLNATRLTLRASRTTESR
jgi:Cu2+-exporting ATPase